MISFSGQTTLVTGGGRGLGQAYCLELARRGAAVVVHDNGVETDGSGGDPQPAHDVAAAIRAAGGRAVACASDASTEEGGRAAVDLAVGEFGRLDAIVANAGIIHADAFADWPTERFEALLRHHLLAAFHVVRPGFAVMRDAGYGRLVFVSSAAGVFGQPGLGG
jgi:NAD(P)-dependent dehydrogenase (short-subunit alcohol dehydrogenase family)